MSYLRQQTLRHLLEIVILVPSRGHLQLEASELSGFLSYTVIETGPIESIGRANALGIRHTTAPIVALAEDHSFPDHNWAQQLIEAHQGPWAAVGPAVRNANPGTSVSWADLIIGYGIWLAPTMSREMDFLPGHNSSYKRDVLMDYGDRLEVMMDSETLLHWDLRSRGHRLYLESAAQVSHTNFSLWSSWIPAQYHNGRLFAGTRVRRMSLMWRIVYFAGAPLIPLVRLYRIARAARNHEVWGHFLRSLPALVIGLVLDGVGQMTGYAVGTGRAIEQVARYEFHRSRHITEQDRHCLFEGTDQSTARMSATRP